VLSPRTQAVVKQGGGPMAAPVSVRRSTAVGTGSAGGEAPVAVQHKRVSSIAPGSAQRGPSLAGGSGKAAWR